MHLIVHTRVLFLLFVLVAESLQNEGMRTDAEIYEEMEGQVTYVGDMILPSPDETARMSWAIQENWPDGVIPYVVSENVTSDLRPIIADAVNYMNKYTCLQFIPKSDDDEYWIRFLMKKNASPNALCSSYVGWTQRPDQGLFLGPKCFFGSMVHEMLHAVGFYHGNSTHEDSFKANREFVSCHKHTRNDRDKYIKVHPENFADSNVAANYALDKTNCNPGQNCTFNDYGVKYNYESIMHYCDTCTSKDYQHKTFTIINGTDGVGDRSKVGQREGFSKGDWLMVNRKYECNIETTKKPKPISAKPVMQKPEDVETFPTFPPLPPTPTVPPTTEPPKKMCKRKAK